MKTLLVILAIAVLLFLAGWITFNFSSDQATITIETEEIEQATQEVVEEGEKVLHDAGAEVREEVERAPEAEIEIDAKPNEDGREHEPAPQGSP